MFADFGSGLLDQFAQAELLVRSTTFASSSKRRESFSCQRANAPDAGDFCPAGDGAGSSRSGFRPFRIDGPGERAFSKMKWRSKRCWSVFSSFGFAIEK
jgi:hypothetical protein